jgi:hypothetical protein
VVLASQSGQRHVVFGSESTTIPSSSHSYSRESGEDHELAPSINIDFFCEIGGDSFLARDGRVFRIPFDSMEKKRKGLSIFGTQTS